jgi:hypothetical protein
MSAITDVNEIEKRIIAAGHSKGYIESKLRELADKMPQFTENRQILLTVLAADLKVLLTIEGQEPAQKLLKAAEIMKLTEDTVVDFNGYFFDYFESKGKGYVIMLDETGRLFISKFLADVPIKYNVFQPVTWKNLKVKVKPGIVYVNIVTDTMHEPYQEEDGPICKLVDIKPDHTIAEVKDRSRPVKYPKIKGKLVGEKIVITRDGDYNACESCGRAGKPNPAGILYCNSCSAAGAPIKYPSYYCNVDDSTGIMKVYLAREVVDEALKEWQKGTTIFVSGYYNDEYDNVKPHVMVKLADPGQQFMPSTTIKETFEPEPEPYVQDNRVIKGTIEKVGETEIEGVLVMPHFGDHHPLAVKIIELLETSNISLSVDDMAYELHEHGSKLSIAVSMLHEKGFIVEDIDRSGFYKLPNR